MSISPDAFGYAATAVTFIQLPPQVLRTVRTRDVRGIAPSMWALLVVAGAAWLLYGIAAGLVPSIVVNLLVVTASVVMLAVLIREGAPGASGAFRVASLGLPAVALVALAAPTWVLGALAALSGMAILWPQTLTALRSRDLSGLAVPTWVLGVVVNACWLAYGIGHGDPAVWISALQSTALTLVVLGRIVITRRDLEPVALAVGA